MMKARFVQYGDNNGNMEAEIIVPSVAENGDVSLWGFNDTRDTFNTSRAIAFAGNLIAYTITKTEKSS